MDDTRFGTRNKRGDWTPFRLIEYPQVFVWPIRPLGLLKWLPEYIVSWNLFYAVIAILMWLYAIPPLETMRTFEVGWIAYLFGCNLALTVLFFGSFHLRLYVQRAQGNSFKFNGKWLETDNPAFLLHNQTIDNLVWSLGSGVPIWTAYQVVTLWVFANGYIPYVRFEDQPVYCVIIMLFLPLFRELHFYCVHRMLHWPPLYRAVHKLHHNNVNPGPWSGLAMHPVEHLLFFSGVLIHWIVPSHPIHAIFHLVDTGLSPAPGHIGFDKVVVSEEKAVDTHCYAHYLHHKYFECNYADGTVPLDKWFGTFNDGSKEAEERMNRRFIARAAKQSGRTL